MMIAQYLYVTIKNGLVKSLVPLCSHQDSWHLVWMSVPQNISKYGIYVLSYPICYFTIIVLVVHHHGSILNTCLAIWINEMIHTTNIWVEMLKLSIHLHTINEYKYNK